MAKRRNGTTWRIVVLLSCLIIGYGCGGEKGSPGPEGPEGPPGPEGPQGGLDTGMAVEACVGCHAPGGDLPVGDVTDPTNAHFVDLDPDGPLTDAGYRQLNITIAQVDVTGTSIVIRFNVTDEDGTPVDDISVSDGRFTIASLRPGQSPGDATFWQSLINRTEDPGAVGDGPGTPTVQATYERFTAGGGVFDSSDAANGNYVYTSAWDPTAPTGAEDLPVVDGDTHRLAIQLSAGDLPAGNGWCDFDADTANPNDCVSAVSSTRDIVQTATCNGCHGATNEVKLTLHGARTEVEYCVTCHTPGTIDANSGNTVDMKVMVHKIHAGAALENGYKIWGFRNSLHDYSTVNFTAGLDDCTFCHDGGGSEQDNWASVPTMEACGSCHDDVDFLAGVNHAGVTGNADCVTCHPPTGPWVPGTAPAPVETVHAGAARASEAALYALPDNGFSIDSLDWDGSDLIIDYSVTRNDVAMDLENDPEWTAPAGASRLAISVAWSSDEYTNEGSGSAPGLPMSFDALDVGGDASRVGVGNTFRVVASLPSGASDTVTVTMDGHPAADLVGSGTYGDRIPVKSAFLDLDIENRGVTTPRRQVVDVARCNQCHDLGRVGISLHGENRTGEPQVCVVCHTADSTDINRRPDPPEPGMTADGKVEETIDFKNMIHRIHAGDIVVWGFAPPPNRGTEHDFTHVEFIGNLRNCETCHLPDTYGAEDAAENALATTIDTGPDLADPSDDLNISPTAAVCSGCHSGDAARDHMVLHGASFIALDEDIH